MHDFFADPALTFALAVLAGVVAQVVARHLAIPGIVVLLATGVLLGPDGLGVVLPQSLDHAVEAIVGFAVAVILFEGGLALDVERMLQRRGVLRRLVTLGATITALGGTLAAALFLGWDLRRSVLFGTLVIVTGPTVVTPLLRRWHVAPRVSELLEAEGVLIDPVGAIVAVVVLEFALAPSGVGLLVAALEVGLRLGFGTVLGLAAGRAIGWALEHERVLPTGLENLAVLGAVMGLYQLSSAVVHESGIAAVTIAGMVVSRFPSPVIEELQGFKEQLTTLFIGLLFVLLAADVRMQEIGALGAGAIATVAFLVFVVRPLTVFTATLGSELGFRERLFMAWVGPRGIVAAAVASLFVTRLDAAGIEGGAELRALTFLVIAGTVAFSGLTGGFVATWLDLRRDSSRAWILLGAGPVARLLARSLQDGGEDVVLVESNPLAVRRAEADGLSAVPGHALDETVLHRAGVGFRRQVVAVTRNAEINALFLRTVDEHTSVETAISARAIDSPVLDEGVDLLFGVEVDLDRWNALLESQEAVVERWELAAADECTPTVSAALHGHDLVAVTRTRQGRPTPVTGGIRFQRDDEALFVVAAAHAGATRERLRELGWRFVGDADLPTAEAPRRVS